MKHYQQLLAPSPLAPRRDKMRSAKISLRSFLVLFSSLVAGIPQLVEAQNSDENLYLGNSKYIEVSVGIGLTRLRDFATSPLYYQGSVQRIGVSLSKQATQRDVSTGFAMIKSSLKNDYNNHTATSSMTTFSVHHSRLYQVFRNGSEKWNYKAGGEVNVLGNLRVNSALMNSQAGIEAFPTLFGTFKVSRDVSRFRGGRTKNRSLGLKVNASILGTSIRNGYSYLGIGQVVDKPGVEGLFDGYRFKVFGVNSLTTTLDYTLWMKNRNGWRFSYGWDAYKTRKDFADFEMAIHTLRVTLLFNTKNN